MEQFYVSQQKPAEPQTYAAIDFELRALKITFLTNMTILACISAL